MIAHIAQALNIPYANAVLGLAALAIFLVSSFGGVVLAIARATRRPRRHR